MDISFFKSQPYFQEGKTTETSFLVEMEENPTHWKKEHTPYNSIILDECRKELIAYTRGKKKKLSCNLKQFLTKKQLKYKKIQFLTPKCKKILIFP